jgi:hypothetical protein
MSPLRAVGLLAVLVGAVLTVLPGPAFVVIAAGLVLLTVSRARPSATVNQRADLMGASAGLVMLTLSGLQPMYWLVPSLPLLAGVLLVLLSRAWRSTDLLVGLVLLPAVLLTTVGALALAWVGSALPEPHGGAELIFFVASLYGPVSMIALVIALWLRRRGGVLAKTRQAGTGSQS